MTTLILTMTEAPTGMKLEARQIDVDRYSLGRNADNDWILPDPACRISRHHCLIRREGDRWTLADVSRNGIDYRARNGAHNNTPNSNSSNGGHPMETGDRFRVGQFEIAVAVQEDEQSFRIAPLPDVVARLRPQHSKPTSPKPASAARPADKGLLAPKFSSARSRLEEAVALVTSSLKMLLRDIPVDRAMSTADAPSAFEPEDALRSACDDLQRHQLCVEHAYTHCMQDLLKILDPASAAAAITKGGPTSRRRRTLALLERRHQRLASHFDAIVRHHFLRRYRAEWVRLTVAARPDDPTMLMPAWLQQPVDPDHTLIIGRATRGQTAPDL